MTPAERLLFSCICEIISSKKFWLSHLYSRGVLQLLLLCLINYDWNGPKEIWGMCQNKANSLARASLFSRTQTHSETSCLWLCKKSSVIGGSSGTHNISQFSKHCNIRLHNPSFNIRSSLQIVLEIKNCT